MHRSSLVRAFTALTLVSGFWCSPLHGQWRAGVEIGAERFWGGSIETTPERRSFRPYRPTAWGLGVEHRAARLGVGLRLRYMSAGLALEGEDAVVAVDGVFDVYSASPELVYRVAVLGLDNELLLRAGPLFEVWSIIDEESKTRVGVQGALSLSIPLGRRFAGLVMAGVGVTPSPFEPNQLDQDYEPRALWRRGVTGRLEYRL